jgi:hypothetical protein
LNGYAKWINSQRFICSLKILELELIMLSRFLITSIALLATISLSTSTVSAGVMLQSFTGGTTFNSFDGDGDTVGYALP